MELKTAGLWPKAKQQSLKFWNGDLALILAASSERWVSPLVPFSHYARFFVFEEDY